MAEDGSASLNSRVNAAEVYSTSMDYKRSE